ncbi:MAG: hypothetical protein HFJ30_05610 [Clostridia bacterium]|jgi:hypothetical protein|nr:hypothetical protein [Clostridia bacterium]MCI9412947.1 hypothetical protein [Clostridia bacterium]
MEFEKRLRDRVYQQRLEQLEIDFQRRFHQDLTTYNFQDVTSRILGAYSIYISNTAKGITREQLHELYDEFEQAISVEALNEMKKNMVLDEDEKMYIQYNEMKEYRGRRKSD